VRKNTHQTSKKQGKRLQHGEFQAKTLGFELICGCNRQKSVLTMLRNNESQLIEGKSQKWTDFYEQSRACTGTQSHKKQPRTRSRATNCTKASQHQCQTAKLKHKVIKKRPHASIPTDFCTVFLLDSSLQQSFSEKLPPKAIPQLLRNAKQ
jgi:hypothetical protein